MWQDGGEVGHRGQDGEDTDKGVEGALGANRDAAENGACKAACERGVERVTVRMGNATDNGA